MASRKDFFDRRSEHSEIKSRIVTSYFAMWARVMMGAATRGQRTVAYLDLFAGPGRYKDGTESTPIAILRKAIGQKDLENALVAIFNDKTKKIAFQLRTAVNELPGIEALKHRPEVENLEVGPAIVGKFERASRMPTFLFADPWGYKGLSLALIQSILKDWGCDCVFFFNYNRINMGISNNVVRVHMDVLFTKQRADSLRSRLPRLQPWERERAVLNELSNALRELGGRYVLPFTFKNATGIRTTHHLIFVSKSFKGYEIMKGIMAKESSTFIDGVPSFEYCAMREGAPPLPDLFRPMAELEKMLLEEFAGRQLTTHQIFERHCVGKDYILQNYKKVLIKLEAENKIETNPPADKRRKNKEGITFGDNVMVIFPKRSKT
jgi:three-Cys-motif partner protein